MDSKVKLSEPTQVRHTGDWSADSKLASIKNGYWDDPYFELFNERSPVPNRTSLICRGYYVRFRVCDYFLRQLIKSINGPFQIVSLGSGMDTTFFRLLHDYGNNITGFFEVDFPTVVENKCQVISKHPKLKKLAGEKLKLVPADLRDLPNLLANLKKAQLNPELPIIFYSECVVNYLESEESTAILHWITENFENGVWLAYEQCYPFDAFGQIMMDHFAKNGCPLRSLQDNSCMDSQRIQLQTAKFQTCSVFNVWDSFVEITNHESSPIPATSNPKQQVFDEYEALLATCLHYSVRIGISEKLSLTKCFQFLSNFSKESSSKPYSKLRPYSSGMLEESLKGQSSFLSCDASAVFAVGGSDQTSKLFPWITKTQFNITKSEDTIKTEKLYSNEAFHRVYSSAVYIPIRKSVVIFGGRKSPLAPCSNALIEVTLTSASKPNGLCVIGQESTDDKLSPCGRWRHQMLCYPSKNLEPALFLFGGKTVDVTSARPIVLGDCWTYTFSGSDSGGLWTKLSSEDSLFPTPRHSHSMCFDPDTKSIFLVGGICLDDTNLCEDALWQFNCAENTWTHWSDFDHLARRIGHVALVHDNHLLIVGGYGNQRDTCLENFITSIHTFKKSVKEFTMEPCKYLPTYRFLPFGFSAHILRPEGSSDESLVVFAGGGNCFSFGSHYNRIYLSFVFMPSMLGEERLESNKLER